MRAFRRNPRNRCTLSRMSVDFNWLSHTRRKPRKIFPKRRTTSSFYLLCDSVPSSVLLLCDIDHQVAKVFIACTSERKFNWIENADRRKEAFEDDLSLGPLSQLEKKFDHMPTSLGSPQILRPTFPQVLIKDFNAM